MYQKTRVSRAKSRGANSKMKRVFICGFSNVESTLDYQIRVMPEQIDQ